MGGNDSMRNSHHDATRGNRTAGVVLLLGGLVGLVAFPVLDLGKHGAIGQCCFGFRSQSQPGVVVDYAPLGWDIRIAWAVATVSSVLVVWGLSMWWTGRRKSVTPGRFVVAPGGLFLAHAARVCGSCVVEDLQERLSSDLLVALLTPVEFANYALFGSALFGAAAVGAVVVGGGVAASVRETTPLKRAFFLAYVAIVLFAGLVSASEGRALEGAMRLVAYSALLSVGPLLVALYAAAPPNESADHSQ